MAQISVGDRVKCQKNGNTDYDFYAKVEKIYETSAFVTTLLRNLCSQN